MAVRHRGHVGRGSTGQARTALIGAGLTTVLLALGLRRRETAPADAPSAGSVRGDPDDNRGRRADGPSEIPARGWWDVLLRVFRSISEDRVLTEAAGVTFYALLAIFPAIGALVSLYGLFADPVTVERQVDMLAGFMPGGGLEILREQLHRVASGGSTKLGLSFVMGLALSLWSANQGTKAMFGALNIVYDEKEKRGFFRLNLTSLAVTLGGILFILLTLGAVVALPVALQFIGLPSRLDSLLHLARWPLLLVGVALMLAVLYRFGPSREKPRWQWVSWGSALAAVAWIAGSAAFSWYVENFGSYNKTYGSLGAVIGFMTWIWLSAAVVLIGGELNAELEHQTARDTTTGPPRPLGTRGARMADQVAPAEG
ncbi:MAG: YihY/virulence factor BrkB family protein [Acetobacteraceae bacterium]|nr:YihY/virulence factor BrkB family protein [Acetobacteraceae bacterium]